MPANIGAAPDLNARRKHSNLLECPVRVQAGERQALGGMKHYDTFKYSDPPGDELGGLIPNSAVEAIGEVTIWFGHLEDTLSVGVEFLVGRGDRVGRIITSELSFRVKLGLFASLVRELAPEGADLDQLDELCGICHKAEELRNTVAHSTWNHGLEEKTMVRRKSTAKAKGGLKDHEEKLHVWQIMDIVAYVGYVAHSVDEFLFMVFGDAYANEDAT